MQATGAADTRFDADQQIRIVATATQPRSMDYVMPDRIAMRTSSDRLPASIFVITLAR